PSAENFWCNPGSIETAACPRALDAVYQLYRGAFVQMDLCRFATRPLAFLGHYVVARPVAHATIVGTVAAAVTCSVGAQYGIKLLVDALSRGAGGPTAAAYAWSAFIVLVALIAADNFLWR